MSVLTVVATPQPGNSPPRVKVDITDTGTPNLTAATVVRTDAAGRVTVVRTTDGNPLQLTTSGSNRVGTVYDVEMPYGLPFKYSTLEQPTNTSATVTVAATVPWLVHIGVPSRSIVLKAVSLSERIREAKRGVFYPQGRATAVVSTDGQRKAPAGTLIARTSTDVDRRAMDALLDDAGTVLLNVPTSRGWGIDTSYVSFGDVVEKRLLNWGSHPYREWSLPFVTVDRPAGGAQAQWTWGDVIATYPTWQALMDAKATWGDVLIPPS